MKEIVLLLEEPSAKEMIDAVAPKIVPDVRVRCIPFEGKQDLERNIIRKLRGYQNPDARFIIVRDQDSGNCKEIKKALLGKCAESRKTLYKVRIMCHELETVFLADLAAVEKGFSLQKLSEMQERAQFRSPDSFPNPKQKLRELLASRHRSYQDISGARSIAPYLDLDNTRSPSFKNLLNAIREMAE